jgi:aspartate/methionine/tyrosine aminotransferase
VIAVNSFSKYFMTGWRLGWLVLPPSLVGAVEKLAQNLYICPSTIAQHAALACFEPSALAQYEQRRTAFAQRRDVAVAALNRIGLAVPVRPDGAFYAYADVSAHAASSWDFCFDLMRRAQVALTPGRDFGHAAGERYLRLSFACDEARLHTALARLEQALR